MNPNLFPHAQRYIPDSWRKLRNAVKLTDGTFVTWPQIHKLASHYNVMGEDVRECLEYLMDIGEVLWFPYITELRDKVFHRPRYIVEIFRCLFCYDFDTRFNWETNRVFIAKGDFTADSFDEAKDNFLKYGQISRPMLQCLWFYLKLDYNNFNKLLTLVPQFDLAYSIPQPEVPMHKRDYQVHPIVVMPWWVTDIQPTDTSDLWSTELPADIKEVKLSFTYPLHYPLGLLERLSCRLQEHVVERIDWRDLIWAKSDHTTILLERKLHPETYDFMLNVSVRGKENSEVQKSVEYLCLHLYSLMCYTPGMVWLLSIRTHHDAVVDVKQCFPQGLFEDQFKVYDNRTGE